MLDLLPPSTLPACKSPEGLLPLPPGRGGTLGRRPPRPPRRRTRPPPRGCRARALRSCGRGAAALRRPGPPGRSRLRLRRPAPGIPRALPLARARGLPSAFTRGPRGARGGTYASLTDVPDTDTFLSLASPAAPGGSRAPSTKASRRARTAPSTRKRLISSGATSLHRPLLRKHRHPPPAPFLLLFLSFSSLLVPSPPDHRPGRLTAAPRRAGAAAQDPARHAVQRRGATGPAVRVAPQRPPALEPLGGAGRGASPHGVQLRRRRRRAASHRRRGRGPPARRRILGREM